MLDCSFIRLPNTCWITIYKMVIFFSFQCWQFSLFLKLQIKKKKKGNGKLMSWQFPPLLFVRTYTLWYWTFCLSLCKCFLTQHNLDPVDQFNWGFVLQTVGLSQILNCYKVYKNILPGRTDRSLWRRTYESLHSRKGAIWAQTLAD